jgi:hypothetical protein
MGCLHVDALQQFRNQAARVRYEARQTDPAGTNVNAIRLREAALPVVKSNEPARALSLITTSTTTDNQQPGLEFRSFRRDHAAKMSQRLNRRGSP